jgi:hypothetical protein
MEELPLHIANSVNQCMILERQAIQEPNLLQILSNIADKTNGNGSSATDTVPRPPASTVAAGGTNEQELKTGKRRNEAVTQYQSQV